jgi:hypothetical protein
MSIVIVFTRPSQQWRTDTRANGMLPFLFLPGHLSSGEQIQGQMECCHFCFYQAVSAMENRYKGKWSAAILANYC